MSRVRAAGIGTSRRHEQMPATRGRVMERGGEHEDFMGVGAADWYQSGVYDDDGIERQKDGDSDILCTAPSSQVSPHCKPLLLSTPHQEGQ